GLVIRARVADVGFNVGDGVGQRRKLTGAIFGHHRQLHGVWVFGFVGHPRDLDDSFAIDHEVRGVLAALGVNADALATRDVAYDLFTANRVTTGRAIDQHVVNPLDQNAIVAQTQRAFDGVGHLPQLRRLGLFDFVQVFGLHKSDQDRPRHELAVTDGREHVVNFSVAVVVEKFLELRVIQHLFGLQAQPGRFLLKNLASDIDRFRTLALGDPVFDLVARL